MSKTHTFIILPFLLFTFARISIAANDPPPSLQGVKTLVTLGDSITQGGAAPGGYVWLMQRYLDALYPQQGVKIVNAGISGHKSTDMAARFQKDVLDPKPQLITISVGVNDVWHGFYDFANRRPIPGGHGPNGVPIAQFRQKVEEMIVLGKNSGARIAVLSTTIIYENLSSPENVRLIYYNQALKELAAKHGCLFIDLNAPFREALRAFQKHAGGAINLLTSDGVHMNAAGNQLMAFTILKGFGIPEKELSTIKQ
jgi:acyl-CoA thioesterase-1